MAKKASEKTVGLGIRVPESRQKELEDAAHAEGATVTDLVLAGIAMVLEKVREKHGGTIPQKPVWQGPVWATAAGSEQPKRKNKK